MTRGVVGGVLLLDEAVGCGLGDGGRVFRGLCVVGFYGRDQHVLETLNAVHQFARLFYFL